MNTDVIITCAITGAGDTTGRSSKVPVSPVEIADAAIEAAEAGAAVTHIHVRDIKTGKGSRDIDLFRETVELIRAKKTDIIINLTAGMGGDWIPDYNNLANGGPGTDMATPEERLQHITELKPEICTLDCGTLNFGDNDDVYISTPRMLREMAKIIQDLKVKPELEVFDIGMAWFAGKMVDEGLVDQPPLFQICLGIPWGAPADTNAMSAIKNALPTNAIWSGFGISRMHMPMVAQAMILGGHVRVGLEDNLYIDKGILATNGDLVTRAKEIIERLGGRVVGPEEARGKLSLKK